MFRKIILSSAFAVLALAVGAQAQSPTKTCNLTSTNNHSCMVEEWMDADGFAISVTGMVFPAGSGNAYVIETSNKTYGDWNSVYITKNDGTTYLSSFVYADGNTRLVCNTAADCPSTIFIKPNTVTGKLLRVNIYRLNN